MKNIKYAIISLAFVVLGGGFWYWQFNRPQLCTNNMMLVSEKQLQKEGLNQILSQNNFEELFDSISHGEYTVYKDFEGCRIPSPEEITAYQVQYRSFYEGEHGTFMISSVRVDQYDSTYVELFANQVERDLDLIIDDNFIFWKDDERYNLVSARPAWIKILRNAKIYGSHNRHVADQTIKRTVHYTSEEMNYPYFNQWIKQPSNTMKLSFNFQEDGTFMANYRKSPCCTSIFNGSYRVSGAVIKLDFDMSSQSAINSSDIPFSWDGNILKLQVDEVWQAFELIE